MTVSSTIRTAGPFVGTGAVSAYPFGFKVFADSDLVVQRTELDGNLTTLVLDSAYTVALNADQNTSPGGVVNLTAPLAAGLVLNIGCALPLLQLTDLVNAGGFFPQTVEDMVDRTVIQLQQTAGGIGGSLRVPEVGSIPVLPAALQRSDRLIGFSSDGETPVASAFSLTVLSQLIAEGWSNQPPPGETVLFLAGMGGADDAIGLTNLAAANPGKIIKNVLSRTLNFNSKARISGDGVWLDLNGAYVLMNAPNGDSLEFSPTTVGVTSAYLNNCGLMNGTISHANVAAASTTGGVKFIQCNGFKCRDITFMDADVYVMGGQLNTFVGCNFYAAHGSWRGVGSACLHVMAAPYGAGSYQAPFTTKFIGWNASATMLRESCMRLHEGDGIEFGVGYGNFATNSVITLMASRQGSYWGACTIEGYIDCVSSAWTPTGITIKDNPAIAGGDTSTMFGLMLRGWVGNGSLSGILCRHSNLREISIDMEIINFGSYGIDIDTQGSTSVIHINAARFGNNGGVSSGGAISLVGGGNSLDIVGCHFTSTKILALKIAGAWQVGTVTGNTNAASGIPDIDVSTATFAQGLAVAGNGSLWTGTLSQSWCVRRMKTSANFANDAAAAAGGIPVGGEYHNAGALRVRIV